MSVGADLELAIKKAAEHYAAADRGELAKQHTPRSFAGQFTATAPIDFKGWERTEVGAREPLYLEAKHTTHSALAFDDKGIDFNQLDALRDAVARRIRYLLVVDAVEVGEVYVVDGREVDAFAVAPWRKSLSLDWLRARGEVAKVSAEPDGDKRRAWFLDTKPHADQFQARLRVLHEQAEAEGKVVELYPARGLNSGLAALTLRDLLACKPGRDATDLERLRWQDRFSAWELERNIREAKKMQARKPMQRRRGWGNR